MHYKNIPDHRHDTQSDTHSYRHKLSAGADKLSEAEQEVLFSWENLGQLERNDREMGVVRAQDGGVDTLGEKRWRLGSFLCAKLQMGDSDINNRVP